MTIQELFAAIRELTRRTPYHSGAMCKEIKGYPAGHIRASDIEKLLLQYENESKDDE